MLRYELMKVWKRPIVWFVLIIVLMYHMFFISTNNLQERKDMKAYLSQYSGVMSDAWREEITNTYQVYINDSSHKMNKNEFQEYGKKYGMSDAKIKRLYKNPANRIKENLQNSNEYLALQEAEEATHFKENLESYIRNLKITYMKHYPQMNSSIIDDNFRGLKANYQKLDFGYQSGWIVIQSGPTLMIRTYSILMIVVLAGIFTQEQGCEVLETVFTTKQGRKKLLYTKIKATIISALIGWFLVLGVHVIISAVLLGLEGANTYKPDFIFEVCPYFLNNIQYTGIQFIMSLIGSIVICLMVSGISAISKKNNTAIILSFAIILLPPFFDIEIMKNILYFYPTNIISSNYILANLAITKLFHMYIPSIYLVFPILSIIVLLIYIYLKKRDCRSFIQDVKNASE